MIRRRWFFAYVTVGTCIIVAAVGYALATPSPARKIVIQPGANGYSGRVTLAQCEALPLGATRQQVEQHFGIPVRVKGLDAGGYAQEVSGVEMDYPQPGTGTLLFCGVTFKGGRVVGRWADLPTGAQ